MKNIFYITGIFIIAACGTVQAQYEGRKFISGQAAIDFDNTKGNSDRDVNNYGYNFDVSLGKFRSETRATGFRLSTSLRGGKNYYLFDNTGVIKENSGINQLGFGLGHFWQFYKHFNSNVGIFGGPDVNLGYKGSKTINNESLIYVSEIKTSQIQLSLGLSAGVYYKLSDKWWVTASLAFANPVSVEYETSKSRMVTDNSESKSNGIRYSLTPAFNFPSVGLGVRYMCK